MGVGQQGSKVPARKIVERFRRRLRSLRKKRGLTQAGLAEAAGITERMITAYETQGVTPPATVLPFLASALGATVDQLLGVDDVQGLAPEPQREAKPTRGRSKASRMDRGTSFRFGSRLAELRLARGLTQRELGEAVGISNRMVAYYERQNGSPSVTLLQRLADALGVTVDELCNGRGAKPPAPRNLRLVARLRRVEELRPAERRQVLQMIDALVDRQRLKKRISG
jgi:transcriptional regulator with XRE-family HTH domain